MLLSESISNRKADSWARVQPRHAGGHIFVTVNTFLMRARIVNMTRLMQETRGGGKKKQKNKEGQTSKSALSSKDNSIAV